MKNSTIFIIALIRLLSALPFAIYYSSLQLYLIRVNFSQPVSTNIVGSVLALSFGLALLGGYIAKRYVDYGKFFIFCIFCQTIGCLTFITNNHEAILWFCSLFLLGGSGLTLCLNMLLTQNYESNDSKREKSFFWLYMALNLGYFIGYALAGYYHSLDNYHNLFYALLIPSILTLILTVNYWKIFNKTNLLSFYKFTVIITLAFLFIRLLLQYAGLANLLIMSIWAISIVVMFFILIKKYPQKIKDIVTFYILLIMALAFWSVYFLSPMALIVFIQNHVKLHIANFSIAPQWFQNINSIIVILGTIFLGSMVKIGFYDTRRIIKQFTIGLCCISIGFAIIVIGIIFSQNSIKISSFWIILSYIFQSGGELLIGPIGYALIGRLIPNIHHNFMMGIWITLLGVAGSIASKISLLSPSINEQISANLNNYQHFFSVITVSIIVITIIFYGITRFFLHRT